LATILYLQFADMSVTTATSFGKWLHDKRLDARLSLESLAGKAKVSKQYLSVLERAAPHALTGKPVTPKPELVERLAKALDADIDEARTAAGYASPSREPQTVKELVERLWDLGIQINFADDLLVDNSPDALERAKASIAAIMQAQFGKFA
jgi:transcriptional regulator with XRE-family HTH domain